MHIHHLDCGTHCPLGGALFDGKSKGLFARIGTRVLLIESEAGLVLVDTGYGLQDVTGKPTQRLPVIWPRLVLNTRLREADTAIRQIEVLGYSPGDVRHIILTHLDFDHAGGLADFPKARVHVLATEKLSAEAARRGFVNRQRYRPADWAHVGDWRTYDEGGDEWFGFSAVRELDGLPPEIRLVPLRGHTLGHAGVAVRTREGWLLQAGDALLHRHELDPNQRMPAGLALYQRIMIRDARAAEENRVKLRAFAEMPGMSVVCSHDLHGCKMSGVETARLTQCPNWR